MQLYNTLTGEATEFAPADGHTVKMYVCGVTPYSATHIGHALSYVAFDVLRRWLEHSGYAVRHVQNFTDVDDKIIQRAAEQGVDPNGLAEEYIGDFFRTMDALNIQRAHIYPRATAEIGPIIHTIGVLVEGGYAYAAGGDVFFRVQRSPGYGKLSHRTLEGMQAGARIEVDENKEHPMDFALWKGARPGEPAWDSPWGPGRPGWHIECTSMSMTYLGETLDIHGGGQDLVFPHHENEIAQSEASTGAVPFARYWVHNGLLRLGEDKMSKSLGNLVSVEEALSRYSPDALRLYFLSSHYRSPLSYTEEGCAAMERSLERLLNALRTAPGGLPGNSGNAPGNSGNAPGNGGNAPGGSDGTPADAAGAPVDAAPFRQRFTAGMDDDLNTPRALAALFDLAREINRGRDAGRPADAAQQELRQLAGLLGLTLDGAGPGRRPDDDNHHRAAEPFIELLLEVRADLRRERQYAQADRIRAGLEQRGIAVEDTPNGPTWTYR